MDRLKLLEEYKDGSDFRDTFKSVAPIAPLNRYLVKDYPTYSLQVPDVIRARVFLRHLKEWETASTIRNSRPCVSIFSRPRPFTKIWELRASLAR